MTRMYTTLAVIWSITAGHQTTQAQVPFEHDFDDGGRESWVETRLAQRPTRFEVVAVDGDSALRATSDRGASAFLNSVRIELGDRAVIRWRWRVEGSIPGNDRERERDGDDYAARLFVVFDDDRLGPDTRAICYVWAAHEPIGSAYRNPFFGRVATVVLESGDAFAGEWLTEERDFVADYRQLFGEAPLTLRAVALMVDTDNTNSRAVAWFDDIAVTVRPRS